jgi:hypothetical protein
MYLTHYGQVGDVANQAANLKRHLAVLVAMAKAEREAGEARHARIKQAVYEYLFAAIRAHGCTLPNDTLQAIWETDVELNAQGLAVWLDSLPA